MNGEPISFNCPSCQTTLSVPVEMAGVTGPCPYCGVEVRSPEVPLTATAAVPVAEVLVTGPDVWTQSAAVMPPMLDVGEPQPPAFVPPVAEAPPARSGRGALVAAVVLAGLAAGGWYGWQQWQKRKVAPGRDDIASGPAIPAMQGQPDPLPAAPAIAGVPDTTSPDKHGAVPAAADQTAGATAAAASVAPADATDETPRDVASIPSAEPADAPAPKESDPEPTPIPAVAAVPPSMEGAVAPAEAVPPPPDANGADPTDKSLWPDGVSPETKAAAPDAAVAARIADVIPKAGYLAKPAAALAAFLAAPTWQERLKHTLAPDKMRPIMESYYKVAKDGPIVPEAVEFTRAVPTEADPKRKYYAFVVFVQGVEGAIPVSVEDTPKGCLVEWRSFVEGHDRLLEKFYAGYRAEPDEFRVLLRRTHYFEKDVPVQDQKLVFEIQPPTTNCAFYAWLDKSSNAYGKHFASGERAGWDATSLVVVRLQWVREESGVEWVRIADIVAEDWHPDSLPAKR